MSTSIAEDKSQLDEAWDSVVGGFDWIKSVLIGEFADNRPLSALIADMLVSFVPGVIIVTSARDAVAVSLRLAQHPEKREHTMEWVVLCACLITIALPLAMAAGGLAVMGVGAIVGGIAGSELGAALRAVMLLLAREGAKLIELIEFLQKFIHGNIMGFLRAVKFAQYEKVLIQALSKITGKLVNICKSVRLHLEKWLKAAEESGAAKWIGEHTDMLKNSAAVRETKAAIAKLADWEQRFYALQQDAIKQVPRALAELDARLTKVLAQTAPKEAHTVASGALADKAVTAVPSKQMVADVPGRAITQAEDKAAAAAPKASKPAKPKAKPAKAEPIPPPKEKPDPLKPPEEGPNKHIQKGTIPPVGMSPENMQRFQEIYGKAPVAKAELDAVADELAKKYGGTVAKAPIKSEERALEKITQDYGGDPSKIKDLARNTIVVPENQIANVTKDLEAMGANIKNVTPEGNPYGYSGVNSTMMTPSGIVGEIQVNSPQMIFAKEPENIARSILGNEVYADIAAKSPVPGGQGHSLYEVGRALPSSSLEAQDVQAASRSYYETIREVFNGN